MSHVDRQVSVACPRAEAALRLDALYRAVGGESGAPARLILRFDVDNLDVRVRTLQSQTVCATFEPQSSTSVRNPRYYVWFEQVVADRTSPVFAGDLSVEGDSDFTSFALILRGEYSKSRFAPDLESDADYLTEIGRATARVFLFRLRDFIEDDRLNAETRDTARRVALVPEVRR